MIPAKKLAFQELIRLMETHADFELAMLGDYVHHASRMHEEVVDLLHRVEMHNRLKAGAQTLKEWLLDHGDYQHTCNRCTSGR